MTVDSAVQFARASADRNAARAVFRSQLAQVRADLAARSIGGRVADRVGRTAADIADEAITVADENRAVIAGTIAALAAWFLRKPIIRGISAVIEDVKKRISR